jgi:hypothetical protein
VGDLGHGHCVAGAARCRQRRRGRQQRTHTGDPGYQKRSPHRAAYAFDHVMAPPLMD